MPKVLQDFLGYAIYFWDNEQGEPPHVHVSKGKPTAGATKRVVQVLQHVKIIGRQHHW